MIGKMYLVGRLLTPKSINVELFKQFLNIKYLRTTGSPSIIRLSHKFDGTFLGYFEWFCLFVSKFVFLSWDGGEGVSKYGK